MNYLNLAELGKNHWWRYVLAILLMLGMWQLIGGIPVGILAVSLIDDGDPATMFDSESMRFIGVDPLVSYLAISFTFITLFAGIWLAVRYLHQRAFLSLITPLQRMSWRRFFTGFFVYLGLIMLFALVGILLGMDEVSFNFDAKKFFIFLPFALLLTPLQACAEELLFRGYVMQGLGRLTSNKITVIVASAILFMLPHLANPEVAIDPVILPLTYFALGAFLAIITLRDNRLELAMGVHSANNLFAFVFMNYEGSALESPSVLTAAQPEPLSSLIVMLLIAALFYVIVFRWLGRDTPSAGVDQGGQEF